LEEILGGVLHLLAEWNFHPYEEVYPGRLRALPA
jgi:hypothetical protein